MSRPWYVARYEGVVDSAALVSGTGSFPSEVEEEEDVEGAEDDEEDECPSLVMISFLGLL